MIDRVTAGAERGRRGARSRAARSGGFTLIELMIVIGIVALLLAVTVPVFFSIGRGTDATSCAANLKAISQALKLYWQDYGAYPGTPDEATAAQAQAAAAAYGAGHFDIGDRPRGFGGLADLYPNYLRNLTTFHCPANLVREPTNAALGKQGWNQYFADTASGWHATDIRNFDPSLWGFNNYGAYYFQDGDPSNWRAYYHRFRPSIALSDPTDRRQLRGSVTGGLVFVPAATVVTWCPYNRRSGTGGAVGTRPHGSDLDIVLFADGTVKRVAARNDELIANAWTGQWREAQP